MSDRKRYVTGVCNSRDEVATAIELGCQLVLLKVCSWPTELTHVVCASEEVASAVAATLPQQLIRLSNPTLPFPVFLSGGPVEETVTLIHQIRGTVHRF